MKPIMTLAEVARVLGWHECNVRTAIRSNRLTASVFGRRMYMIRQDDLERFVRSHPRPSRVAHVAIH